MPRARFYNRRSRHEHPRKHPFRRLPAERRGKTRRRSTSRPLSSSRLSPPAFLRRRTTLRSSDLQQLALDGAITGFRSFDSLLPTVMPDLPRSSRGRGGAQALSAEGAPVESNPLTPLLADCGEDCVSRFFSRQATSHPPTARQCRQFLRDRGLGRRTRLRDPQPQAQQRGAFHRPRPARGPFRAPARSGSIRWPADGAAARVRPGSKTSTRPLFATLFARAFKAACALTTSASGCFHEHDHGPLETPQTTGKWLGRLSPVSESCLSTGTTAEASQGQGPRTPCLGTPHRDCSRWRLRPDLVGFGHLLSREPLLSLSGATRETGGTASAGHACKRAPRQGRAACHLREEGRRSPTRGAFYPQTARDTDRCTG